MSFWSQDGIKLNENLQYYQNGDQRVGWIMRIKRNAQAEQKFFTL